MLKLNASYSKKVPADGEFTSQSYHAAIEVELPDGLSAEQLNGKIHETFALVRNSVEAELHGQTSAVTAAVVPTPPQGGNTGNYSHSRKNGGSSDAPASPKQIKFLLDLARNCGITPEQIKARFGVAVLEALTKSQCSRAIDEFSGKVVA